jgi:voltage-gated potassium channel
MNYQRKILIAPILLISLLIIGTVGYLFLEKDNPAGEWQLLDAIYMTVITLTTVGYGNMGMSDAGRVFTLFLLIGGFGVFTYSVTIATSFLIEGQLQSFFRQQKMIRTVDKLLNHYIVCGLGDTGVHVLDEMLKAEVDFVGIELEEERLVHLSDTRDFLYLQGDATDDELLTRAGIERAQGLVTCLSRDQDNLFVVISARKLNPHLKIASKAVEDNSPEKLITAGADEVVLPDHIGGLRLASGILQPQLVGFLENMTQNRQGAQFTESIIQEGAPLDGISLKAASIQEQTGLVVVAIQDSNGGFLYNPPGDKKIVAGDALLVIASQKQLQTLHKLTGDLG